MEHWKLIEMAALPVYEVSSLGRVRRLSGLDRRGRRWKARILTPCAGTDGRLRVAIPVENTHRGRRDVYVHQLVLLAFVGSPPGKLGAHHGEYGCNHKNGNFLDNRVENLEWATKEANWEHAHRNNLFAPKPGDPRIRLTDSAVNKARALCASGVSQAEVARRLHVHQCHISRIVSGKRRRFVPQ